jgi:uncharacterized protein GlcG (DUF336 family)
MMKKTIIALLFATSMIASAAEQATSHGALMLVTVLDSNGQSMASYSVPGYIDHTACEARQSQVTHDVMDAHLGLGIVSARCVDL